MTGTFTLTATVTDAAGASATGTYSLFINGPLFLLTSTLPNATVGSAYSTILAASGGTSPYTFTVTGLPPGITASNGGTLSRTPTQRRNFLVNREDHRQCADKRARDAVTARGAPHRPRAQLHRRAAHFGGGNPKLGPDRAGPRYYPVAITVNLTLSFTPTSGMEPMIPAVQFAAAGEPRRVTIYCRLYRIVHKRRCPDWNGGRDHYHHRAAFGGIAERHIRIQRRNRPSPSTPARRSLRR